MNNHQHQVEDNRLKSIAERKARIAYYQEMYAQKYGKTTADNSAIDYTALYKYINETVEKAMEKYACKDYSAKSYSDTEVIEELLAFLREHKKKVGAQQAVKDLQLGLNILGVDKKRLPSNLRERLKEDGDFGDRTFSFLKDLCNYYPPTIIKKYIRRGAINNMIFAAKNNPANDTVKKISEICQDLNIERKI